MWFNLRPFLFAGHVVVRAVDVVYRGNRREVLLNPVHFCNHTFRGIFMVNVIVPTLNAASGWLQFVPKLIDCIQSEQVLIVDSESSDGTYELAASCGFQVRSIRRSEFNHGGTRQLAAALLPDADILVYLTQDAILSSPDAISNLVAAFSDPNVAVAYGRQLPRPGANAIEAHARLFNYPPTSAVRSIADRPQLGFKTVFVSNSFAAYRRSALMKVGGFPSDTIFGEDTITAGKLLLEGYKIAYVAEAAVFHSHANTWAKEFKRYFDIGVLHSREHWLLETFGGAGGAGSRFVVSEASHLLRENMFLLPGAIVRTVLKYVGYRLGRIEAKLPAELKRRLSMNRRYWSNG